MPLSTLTLAVLLATPIPLVADPAGRSPEETARAVLFARSEADLEPYLLRSTREQLSLIDPDLREALLEVLRPLGAMQQMKDVRVERLHGDGPLARVTIDAEVVEVGLGPPDPKWRERKREEQGQDPDPREEGLMELEMSVSEPKGASVYILPMLLGLRKEDGAWRVARADYGVNPFHLDFLALAYWLEDPNLAQRVNQAVATANARAVIGDVRTVVSAEIAYSGANGGFFDTLPCLAKPTDCLLELPAGSPAFVSDVLASLESKNGYARSFHSGLPPSPDQLRDAHASASSLLAFAYVAVPTRPGVTGTASFCGDSTGRICVEREGLPQVVDGLCNPCRSLE